MSNRHPVAEFLIRRCFSMVRILPRIRASARENIVRSEVIDFPELGMEAVRAIDVVDFPAFIIVDNKGNDLYAHI